MCVCVWGGLGWIAKRQENLGAFVKCSLPALCGGFAGVSICPSVSNCMCHPMREVQLKHAQLIAGTLNLIKIVINSTCAYVGGGEGRRMRQLANLVTVNNMK